MKSANIPRRRRNGWGLYCIWDADQVEDIESCFESTELDRIAPIQQVLVGAYFDVAAFGEQAV